MSSSHDATHRGKNKVFSAKKKKGMNEFNYDILFKFTDVGVHYFKAH